MSGFPAPSRLRARLRRVARDDQGTATIEFVILFPLVVSVMLMSFETSIIMARHLLLDRAMDSAVRILRLGAQPDIDHDELKQLVCDGAAFLANCTTSLKIEMVPVSKTAWNIPTSAPECVDRGQTATPVKNFDQGPDNELMMVRACLTVDPFFPGIGLGLKLDQAPQDGFYLISTSFFVNEPGSGG